MKKTASKRGSKAVKKVARTRSQKPVDLEAIRKEIATIVGGEAVSMVETTMEEVGKGHYAAMKFLFEMIGLYPVSGPAEPAGEDSLASQLFRRLGLPEEAKSETEVTKARATEPVAAAEDAVE
jgi:hypothetical protein